MSKRFLQFVGAASVFALVAGCGGGGSGSGGTGGGGNGGGGNSTTVTVNFSGVPPTVVATKIGSGALTSATLSSSAVNLTIPSGTTTFGVAYLCPTEEIGGLGVVNVAPEFLMESTIADGTSYTIRCPSVPSAGPSGTLTGNVDATAILGSGQGIVVVGAMNGANLTEYQMLGFSGAVSLAAPAGNDRVDIDAYTETFIGNEPLIFLAAAKTFQNQAVPGAINGGSTVTLASTDSTTAEPITFSGLPAGFSTPILNGSFQPTGQTFGIQLMYGEATQYPVPPVGVTQGGGTYVMDAVSFDTSNGGSAVVAATSFSQTAPITLAFPSAWTYTGPTPAALPTMNFAYTGFSGQSGVSYAATVFWNTGVSTENAIEVDASSKFVASSPSLTIPDLSSVSGFFGGPASGTTEAWAAIIYASNAGTLQDTYQLLPAGTSLQGVETLGSFTVP